MEKGRKGMIAKMWERCRSMRGSGRGSPERTYTPNTRPWTSWRRKAQPPVGWFSVYVGERREQFMVRTDYLNHSIFRSLLEEAEVEFGYATDGPLQLPCDAELFRSLLWEVERDFDDGPVVATCPSPLAPSSSGYELLRPARTPPWRAPRAPRR